MKSTPELATHLRSRLKAQVNDSLWAVGEGSVSRVALRRRCASFYAVSSGEKPFITHMVISDEKGNCVKTKVKAWPTRWPLDATR